ncbi:L-dopachrome tautomerase-related protein [Cobetia marina]|uniref:L-dopachrome tautomerase-related protein n=1 Tax=Cobetia marina TaxID=28258 RepID=UPI001143E9D5|nr:L-dopachrome tautomerase-related protein [Cobetia marina]GED43373.1 periplasmic protein [Cobetia marina]
MHNAVRSTRYLGVFALLSGLLTGCATGHSTLPATTSSLKPGPAYGEMRSVAVMQIRPGNVAVTPAGRVFATIHPMDGDHDVQLVEITGQNSYRAWPSPAFQTHAGRYSDATIDSPLGIYQDGQGGLWITDMGLHLGKTRLWGFDIASGKLITKLTLPTDIAPEGSFVQDLAVDRSRGVAYLVDIANPGLITVDLASGEASRFSQHAALQAEPDATLKIDGRDIPFNGKPAKVGVDPITLSDDGETVFFGAMTGHSWYSVPARLLREGADHDTIAAAITRVGDKPISDGADTAGGIHYFTNLNQHGLDVLGADGKLTPLVRDERLDWPDGVRMAADGWLYVTVNQLDSTPPFAGGEDEGQPPYHIYKVWPTDD